MFNIVKKEFEIAGQQVTIETGRIARQASSVLVTMGKTSVLVAAVAKKEPKPGQDFFPLTINYQEKAYAAGKIPGGYGKREGRPSEKEILTARLIDRPLRPLFPKGFKNEIQVTCSVLSSDKLNDADIAALIGSSAAIAITGAPFNGPIGASRVGFINGEYVLNPSHAQLAESDLDLVVAGTDSAVLMVESEANELTEDQMLGAVLFGQQHNQTIVEVIKAFAAEVNTPAWEWAPEEKNEALIAQVQAQFGDAIADAYKITQKALRYDKLAELKAEAFSAFVGEEEGLSTQQEVAGIFGGI